MLLFPSKTGQNKKLIRQYCLKKRQDMFQYGIMDSISKKIVNNILNSQIFENAKHIMLFYPIKFEINLLALLECRDKTFYFPKCNGNDLLVCPNSNEFENNKYSIPEPVSDALCDLKILDIIFTPALCADKNKYRIGYGGGYYDRFFSKNNLSAKKIIPISKEFVCEKLPIDMQDIPCDMLLCEDGFM